MSFEKAKKHLELLNLDNRVIEFPVSTATVREAAIALGCTDGEIAKSLAFIVNEKAILVLAAGDQKIDNAKFKAEFNTKANTHNVIIVIIQNKLVFLSFRCILKKILINYKKLLLFPKKCVRIHYA